MACYATFKLYLLHEQLDFGQAALHAAGLSSFLKRYENVQSDILRPRPASHAIG